MHTTKIVLATLIVSVTLFPNIARCQIILTLTDGGGSTVNWSFSGSSTISTGFNVSPLSTNSMRLPPSSTWNSFFSAGIFDDAGSELLNVSNVTPGTVATSGDPAVFVDGSRVPLDGGGFATGGTRPLQIDRRRTTKPQHIVVGGVN